MSGTGKRERMIQARAKLVALQKAEADVREEIARGEPPFKSGDLVELKSGGFHMMAEGCRERCRAPEETDIWSVDLIWAENQSAPGLARTTVPASVIQRVPEIDGKPRSPIRSLYDDLPF